MQKQEAEQVFVTVCKDAQIWREQAKQLKLCADLIKGQFQVVMPLMRFEHGHREVFMALLKGYMLLIGMSFENLIKGVLVGRDPSLVSREVISHKLLPRGGHGISEGAKKVTNISSSEFDLLRRLEEYLVWAGKYPMPLKSEVFLNSNHPENLRSFRHPTDFDQIEELFNKLTAVLVNEWELRERSRYA